MKLFHTNTYSNFYLTFLPLTLTSVFSKFTDLQINDPDNPLPESHKTACFGHEPEGCETKHTTNTKCELTSRTIHWVKDYPEDRKLEGVYDKWDEYVDFGYVKKKRGQLTNITAGLRCIHHLRMCHGNDIYFEFDKMGGGVYRTDVVKKVASVCQREDKSECQNEDWGNKKKTVNKEFIEANSDHVGALQSWGSEVKGIGSIYLPLGKKVKVDRTIDKDVIFIKIDAGINMFHHFCDFVNLYMTQHLLNEFSKDVQVVIWQTSGQYWSYFMDMINVFTKYPAIHLTSFSEKSVRFRGKVTFPLLSRQRYGLFYNTPLVPHCQGSGIFRAFSEHVKHRFDFPITMPEKEKCRVTFLSRGTWKKDSGIYGRLVSNEDQMLAHARRFFPRCEFTKVQFTKQVPFMKQMEIITKTKVFVGMHGAGLTHLLFLPDTSKVIELYNCEDRGCYRDLAYLRGIPYFTWTDVFDDPEVPPKQQGPRLNPQYIPPGVNPIDYKRHAKYAENQKFWNFEFDLDNWIDLLRKAIPEEYRALKVKEIEIEKPNIHEQQINEPKIEQKTEL